MAGHHASDGWQEGVTSLIFPAYNPGAFLERTWREVKQFLHTAPGLWEVIFVCDGCTDGSVERLLEWSRPLADQVRVLHYTRNRGKGYAVRRGLEAAQGAWRLFTDVDLAYSFEDILHLAQILWQGNEVAIASRTHPDSRILLPSQLQGYIYRRHLQSLVFAGVARLLLPITQWDTQAGLKGMSAWTAQRILPHLQCDGFGFDCELLTACARYGFPVTEMPVLVRFENQDSTTNFSAVGRMLSELWHIRRVWRQAPPLSDDLSKPERRIAA